MSKCVICTKLYHPDYMVVKDIRGENVKVCAFCHTDKKELTVTDNNGKLVEVIKKDEASRAYMKCLHRLKDNPKIFEILTKEE